MSPPGTQGDGAGALRDRSLCSSVARSCATPRESHDASGSDRAFPFEVCSWWHRLPLRHVPPPGGPGCSLGDPNPTGLVSTPMAFRGAALLGMSHPLVPEKWVKSGGFVPVRHRAAACTAVEQTKGC